MLPCWSLSSISLVVPDIIVSIRAIPSPTEEKLANLWRIKIHRNGILVRILRINTLK